MTDLLVLVPPSEGKAPGGAGRWRPGGGSFGRRLGERRSEVVAALAAPGAADERTLGVRGELLVRALGATARLGAGNAQSLPAWQRYTGVVWEHLDPSDLDDAERRRLLVPSALLGLATGVDPVPDHRLKFSVSLPGIGRLDRWWRPQVTAVLAALPRVTTIVDLLPNEHRAAIDFDDRALRRRHELVRVEFTDARGAAVGHDAKAAKGRFAKHLLVAGLDGVDGWSDEGRASVTTGEQSLAVRLG